MQLQRADIWRGSNWVKILFPERWSKFVEFKNQKSEVWLYYAVADPGEGSPLFMHQSIPTASFPPPPSQLLQGICPHCKSQELGICQPWGISRAFNRHVVSYPNITERGGCYWKHKQMSMGWGGEKLLETLCMHFFIAFQARTYVAKSRAIDMNRCTVCFGYLIKFLLIQDFNKIKWRWF